MLRRPKNLFAVYIAVAALVTSACSPSESPERDRPVIGFILVGDRTDLGYNQAAWEGLEAVARAFPSHQVIGLEDIPETDAATDALEDLVDRGAEILFATSFGHLDQAYEVASRHEDVVVVHQGGVEPEPGLANFGTFFGAHSEAMYRAGIAAGGRTESGRLGFVVAFPIPATFNNVNAFLLGARRITPDATVDVVFTDSWCDPTTQAEAAEQLIASGVDVIAQHQDCTETVLGAAEDAGIGAVGYHYDGSEVAPKAWLTGAIWIWEDLYIDIVATVLAGEFAGSQYDSDFRGTLAGGDNPFTLAEPGPTVDEPTLEIMEKALVELRTGQRAVFQGPLFVNGEARVAESRRLSVTEIDAMDYFLDGVALVGDEPT